MYFSFRSEGLAEADSLKASGFWRKRVCPGPHGSDLQRGNPVNASNATKPETQLGTNRYYGLGVDALVTVCSGNTNSIFGLCMDALVIGCTRNTNVIMVWAGMLWRPYALGTPTSLCCAHGCSGYRMRWKHERYNGLGMDAVVSVRTRSANVIMVCVWMLWWAYALETRTLYFVALGMDALVIPRTQTSKKSDAW